MSDNGGKQDERWGEDWLMAAGSLLMSGRAAEGPLSGCSLAQAARALTLRRPCRPRRTRRCLHSSRPDARDCSMWWTCSPPGPWDAGAAAR